MRILLQLRGGSMAHFELAAGRVSRAVAHHAVDELCYILRGHGQMWRCLAGRQQTAPLEAGTCLSIPVGAGCLKPGRRRVWTAATVPSRLRSRRRAGALPKDTAVGGEPG